MIPDKRFLVLDCQTQSQIQEKKKMLSNEAKKKEKKKTEHG